MAVLEKRPAPTWGGRPLSDLTDQEVALALSLSAQVSEITREHAPKPVWAFFASALSDLTVEQARRMVR